MTKGNIVFTGSFWDYFLKSILLFLLCVVTLGIAIPYLIYWNFAYFFKHLEIVFQDVPAGHVAEVVT
jgi:uncharacterized membrane protein YjgN (DUF898 family)